MVQFIKLDVIFPKIIGVVTVNDDRYRATFIEFIWQYLKTLILIRCGFNRGGAGITFHTDNATLYFLIDM